MYLLGYLLSHFIFYSLIFSIEAFFPHKSHFTRTSQRKVLNTLRNVDPRLAATLLGLSFIGNIGEAIITISRDPQALFCTLESRLANDNSDSCQQLPAFVRYRGGKLLTIKQDWGGSVSTGGAVWNGANILTWYMENKLDHNALRGKSVLELGAGVGFVSLVANALGATNVVVSDGNTDVLQIADKNIEINVDRKQRANIRTAQLQWGSDDVKSFIDTNWDYILASDVTYKKTAWAPLMGSIARLSGPNTVTLLTVEPRVIGEIEGILAEAELQGLQWIEQQLQYPIVDEDNTQCKLLCPRLFLLTKNPHTVSPYILSTVLPMMEY